MALDSIASEYSRMRYAERGEQSPYPDWEFIEELIEADYSWDGVGVFWNKSDDTYWWGTDSGCSCYGPWESTEPSDLLPLDNAHAKEFAEAVKGVGGYNDEEHTSFIHRMLKEADIYPGVIEG